MATEECDWYHLTPSGWARGDEERPADAVISGEWCVGDHAFARGYWREQWRSSDGDAVKALIAKYRKAPR